MLERAAQVPLQRDAPGDPGIDRGGEEGKGVAPRLFRLIHRGVCLLEQQAGVGAVVGIERNADARRGEAVALVQVDRLSEPLEDFAGHHPGVVRRTQIGKHQDELVAPQPGHRVLLAHAVRQPLRDLYQQTVARIVPECIVDILESVQVHEHHRYQGVRAPRILEQLAQPVHRQRSVRQAGESVETGLADQTLLVILAQADVFFQADVMGDLPIARLERRDDRVFPVQIAILAPVADLALPDHPC